MRKDAVVCKSVEHWTGGAGVPFLGRNILRPREAMAIGMRRDNVPSFE